MLGCLPKFLSSSAFLDIVSFTASVAILTNVLAAACLRLPLLTLNF
jgi:hypothetical protein